MLPRYRSQYAVFPPATLVPSIAAFSGGTEELGPGGSSSQGDGISFKVLALATAAVASLATAMFYLIQRAAQASVRTGNTATGVLGGRGLNIGGTGFELANLGRARQRKGDDDFVVKEGGGGGKQGYARLLAGHEEEEEHGRQSREGGSRR